MSFDIAVSWVGYDDEPCRGKWDQRFIGRILDGQEGAPPGAYRFVDTPWTPDDGIGRVIIFPSGGYRPRGIEHTVRARFARDLEKLDWAVVIATSDEAQTFDWHMIDPWPSHVKLWVMLPRIDHSYPPGTRFIGEGSPLSALDWYQEAALKRDLDVFFGGQGGHERRQFARAAISKLGDRGLHVKGYQTESFLHDSDGHVVPEPGADYEYVHDMTRAWIAPCPSGIESQSSFRFYEALEAGSIPIVDELSRHGNKGFWEMLELDKVAPRIESWPDLGVMCDALLKDRAGVAAGVSSRWQQYKRRLIRNLHDDVAFFTGVRHVTPPQDAVTVIIPTSPVPSNPDLSMIQATIESVRVELPGAEILIAADGIRDEQRHMRDQYHHYLHELCRWANASYNIYVFTHDEHLHQAGLMKSVLPEVTTEFILFVEHDTPLQGTVPFAEIIKTMDQHDLNSMRFLHEVAIPEGSEHLFVDDTPCWSDGAPYVRTIQWSQRPHLARADWYRTIISRYFGSEARTFIEDVMHGVVQYGIGLPTNDLYADRIRAAEAWQRWRMAVYAPNSNWKRSSHLDGRAGGSKFTVVFAYDGERPEDAPAPGEYRT